MSKSKYSWRYLMVAATAIVSPAFAQTSNVGISIEAADPEVTQVPYKGTADFAVTVTNAGPDSAAGIKVTAAELTIGKVTGFTGDCIPLSKDGGTPKDPAVCELRLADGGTSLPNGETATFTYTVSYPELESLESCPAAENLKADVTTTTTDPTPANNSATVNDIFYPVADISGTIEGDAPMSTDGGVPAKRYLPGQTVTVHGTITNAGPCEAPANKVTIDTTDGVNGLTGTDVMGLCDSWEKGVCTLPMAIGMGDKLEFDMSRNIADLPSNDAGGFYIIQSAAYAGFTIAYPGNPKEGETAPRTEIMVKGPADGACAVAGGGLLFPLALLVLARRRRNNRG